MSTLTSAEQSQSNNTNFVDSNFVTNENERSQNSSFQSHPSSFCACIQCAKAHSFPRTHVARRDREPSVQANISAAAADTYLAHLRSADAAAPLFGAHASLQALAAEKRSNEYAANASLPQLIQINNSVKPTIAMPPTGSVPNSISMFFDINTRAFYYAAAPLHPSHIPVPTSAVPPHAQFTAPQTTQNRAAAASAIPTIIQSSEPRSRSPLSVVAAHIRKRSQQRKKGFGPAEIDLMSIEELISDSSFSDSQQYQQRNDDSPFVSLDPLPLPRGRVALLSAVNGAAANLNQHSLNALPSVLNSIEQTDEHQFAERIRSRRHLDELQRYQSGRQTLANILDDPVFGLDSQPTDRRVRLYNPSDDENLNDSVDGNDVFRVLMRRPIPPSPASRARLRQVERQRATANKLYSNQKSFSPNDSFESTDEQLHHTNTSLLASPVVPSTKSSMKTEKSAAARTLRGTNAALLAGEHDYHPFHMGRTVMDPDVSELVNIGVDEEIERYAEVSLGQTLGKLSAVPRRAEAFAHEVAKASANGASALSDNCDSICEPSPLPALKNHANHSTDPMSDFDNLSHLSDLSVLSILPDHDIVADEEFEFQPSASRNVEMSPQSLHVAATSNVMSVTDDGISNELSLQLPAWASEIAEANIE
jgi:hypothetical protein